ncbi:MAG TPA: SRPBCC domain-containing protein [Rhizomicrobium sp.]
MAMANAAMKHDDRVLVIERMFDAPRTLVWKAFTDPTHMVAWMGPRDHPSVLHEADVRPGGKWRGRLRAVDGSRELGQGGEYHEVREPERLAFTFYWDQDDGSRGPETLVEIDFAERGGKTLMTFRQGVFDTSPNRDGHNRGWNSTFDRLADYLAAQGAQS